MSKAIDQYISQKNIPAALEECLRDNQPYLGLLLAKICLGFQKEPNSRVHELYRQLVGNVNSMKKDGTEVLIHEDTGIDENPSLLPNISEEIEKVEETVTRVMLYCNWCESKDLCEIWNKMSKGNYRWNDIQIVWEEPADYYVVINCPPINIFPDAKRTIIFQMEPNMETNPQMWGNWATPKEEDYLWVGLHKVHFNNNEWHLGQTYDQLMTNEIKKNDEVANILSTVLSDKYKDPGHIKRIDFVKFLESKNIPVHVYGGNKFLWKDYKGSPPYHNKDEAILPYKYTFNVENQSIRGYYTEKLIDGILGETLTFYSGCQNIRDYFDERAFVWLELVDFESDYQKIKKAIEEDWWGQRIDIIRQEKLRILTEKQFFPRLEQIIDEHKKS